MLQLLEIGLMVLQTLVEDDCSLAGFASFSREWQGTIEQHTFTRVRLQAFPQDRSYVRIPNISLSQTLYRANLSLESLSESFMVDASNFFTFDKYQLQQKWPNLHSLVLT